MKVHAIQENIQRIVIRFREIAKICAQEGNEKKFQECYQKVQQTSKQNVENVLVFHFNYDRSKEEGKISCYGEEMTTIETRRISSKVH